jgi:hypothetical protein
MSPTDAASASIFTDGLTSRVVQAQAITAAQCAEIAAVRITALHSWTHTLTLTLTLTLTYTHTLESNYASHPMAGLSSQARMRRRLPPLPLSRTPRSRTPRR